MVDIPRPDLARWKRLKLSLYAATAIIVVALVTVVVSRLEPAAPRVDADTVYTDTVARGSMVRQVRGAGTLVPEEIRWITATTQGIVERILLRPGATVTATTVILELSNPELEQTVLEARLETDAGQAQLENRRAELESSVLNQQATVATVEAASREAALQAEADEALAERGLVSNLQLKISRSKANELETRARIERQRYEIAQASVESQLAPQKAEVNRLQTMYELRRRQLDDLRVRAGMSGILQVVPVEVGQQVAPGTNLCRVADPRNLKAELRIAETQAKDIQIGQPAAIDTRNGIAWGRVARIDPAVQNGTVTVDVILEDELPRGARPDLTVDGTIELERLEDILYVGRPVFGQEGAAVSLFRLEPDGQYASRTRVRLGRSSVATIELLEGLEAGDEVILSNMSAWDMFDRIQLQR